MNKTTSAVLAALVLLAANGAATAAPQDSPAAAQGVTADSIVNLDTEKGSDRLGKISAEILDRVYTPDWRRGRFVFRPGAQTGKYQVAVRVFVDKKVLDERAAQEIAFQPSRPSVTPESTSVVGTIPASNLLKLNGVRGVLSVEEPAVTTVRFTGNPAPVILKRSNSIVLEEAGVPAAWARWGRGAGVKVGIIDGGFTNLNELMAAGVLPKDRVIVRQPMPEQAAKQMPLGVDIHGSAVAEVIHEIAPEATLYLYPTACITSAWERAVEMAVEDGVDVVNSSLNSTYGALDGLGAPNTYIEPALEAGILYVNSAGNQGASVYASPFFDCDGNGWHNFAVDDEGNAVHLEKGDAFSATLSWDDFGSNPETPVSDQDFDLYLTMLDPRSGRSLQIADSKNVQAAESDNPEPPMERITLPPEGAPATGLYTLMIRANRVDPGRTFNMRLIVEAYDFDAPPPSIYKPLQYRSDAMTMTKPADDAGVVTVAAVGVDGNRHPYSGTGPSLVPGVKKPDVSGYTGLLTSSMQNPFLGTSCAAPFVAGCAALLWQEFPSADKVKEELRKRAWDRGIPGHDFLYGYGIVNLDDPAPSVPTATLNSVSRFRDVTSAGVPGFNMIVVFTSDGAYGDRLFTSLYFTRPDGKPVAAGKGLDVFRGENGELRVASYLTPAENRVTAFEKWMFVPAAVLEIAGRDAIAELRVECRVGDALRTLDSRKIGPVGKLVDPGTGGLSKSESPSKKGR